MLRTSLLLFLLAPPALASSQFPGVIKTKYTLAAEPPCALCHTNGITGVGTVNTLFGTNLRMRGLVSGSDASLIAALDTAAGQNLDSDGDGVTDVAELMAGTDPNTAPSDGGTGGGTGGGGGTVLGPPRFGCGATVVPELLFLAALLPLLRRRSKRG
jgi:hypothetical protein